MIDLAHRLRERFAEQSTRRQARRDPQTLLVAATAITLGALVASPAFADAAAGVILGGIAINAAYDWVKGLLALPPGDAEAREDHVERGLAAGDPGARAAATAALAAAGPQIAAALPADDRAAFIEALRQSMAQSGGPLAEVAPAYAAALGQPDRADWAQIRALAARQIQISATIEAAERATIRESPIAIRDTAAPIDARISAGPDATIERSGIAIEGVGAPPAAPGAGAPRTINVGTTANGGAVSDSPASYIERADNVILQAADPAVAQRRADLEGYLEYTVRARNALDLGKIDRTDSSYARPMELAHVYIALSTTSTVENMRQQGARQPRPLSVIEAMSQAPQRRAMLLGAPGSGKSTFVSYLAHSLAEAALAALRRAPDAAQQLAALPGWGYGALIPVPIILRDLAAFAPVAAAARGSVDLFLQFLRAHTDELACPHALVPLVAALRGGKALLLLDGLDEVVGDTVLPRVAETIQAFPGPILVTCRVLDYQEERRRQLAGFQAHTLAELEPAQIDAFIAAWYRELADSGRRPPTQAAAETRQMQGAVQSRDELRALAGSPLLLTLMAQVHAFRGTLPDARARLYEECIDLLLLTWRQPRDGEPDLISRLGLSRFSDSSLRDLMARLGFMAHSQAERSQDSAGPADLGEAQVLEMLAERFADYDADPIRCQTRAATVLQALARGNGLLLKRGPKTYTFAHRTFQEFLAGFHLKGLRNAQAESIQRAGQIHWHEALLLMAGYQVLREGELDRPIELAKKLLERDELACCLAGDLLVLVGQERARGFDPELVAREGLWVQAIRRLRAIQGQGAAPHAPATLRHRAGLALGRLCYGELKDLTIASARPPRPELALPLALVNLIQPASPTWPKALAHYWCPIEAGPFWWGDDRNEPLKPATISRPYRIGRYPITNADFARFLAANGPAGYDPARPWWTKHGRAYLLPGGYRFEGEPEQITHPRYWTVARYNGATQPVVGVSWYEAAAYCRWLTSVGHAQGWLPVDSEIRLPTWHEWERAARHTDRRRHPWGDPPPDPERANYQDTRISAPAPVGCFPLGAAACGAQDLLGNVLEWTATPYQQPDRPDAAEDFTTSDGVVISWNSWANKVEDLCCGARVGYFPCSRGDSWSFRVVQSLRARV